jgi:hypothetical protein
MDIEFGEHWQLPEVPLVFLAVTPLLRLVFS